MNDIARRELVPPHLGWTAMLHRIVVLENKALQEGGLI